MKGVCCLGDRAWRAQLQLGQVLTLRVVAGMSAGTNIDDRMFAHLLQLWIVPTAAQGVALVVMGGVGGPLRADLARLGFREGDEDLLPVPFVVVSAIESRAPVVERVEKPVLQDYPAVLAEHTAMVSVLLALGHDVLVADRRRRRSLPWHPTPSQESKGIEGVRNAREVPHACQSAPSGAKDVFGFFAPLGGVFPACASRVQLFKT